MQSKHYFIRVDFRYFKAFERFTLYLRHFNILVGPNNAGKSTILAAFRILDSALRKARSRNPEMVHGPNGETFGYAIDLSQTSIAEENIFYNYDDSEIATVKFHLSNKNSLLLIFPERGICYLIADSEIGTIRDTKTFKEQFNCLIGFVPILGPVEHRERLYKREAATQALFNYMAARNFRNIWYHYPEKFEEFRRMLHETWPSMDVEAPIVEYSHGKPVLYMFCPEERIPREIFWSGFGFQVWCQMLTHLVQSSDKSLFLIDEPDIYLHSDLQRQLLGLLRELGPDILIATHSTEIVTEADPEDIVLINKKHARSKRIKHPSDLLAVFLALGSNLNPILTQLTKTKRVVFVEGKDFQVIAKFARKLNKLIVANRAGFAVVPVEGFNPDRIRSIKKGMEETLGGKVSAAAIFDRDYRSQNECEVIAKDSEEFCELVRFHRCKEIENFLLIPSAIDRAAKIKVVDRNIRNGVNQQYEENAEAILDEIASEMKAKVQARYIASRQDFDKRQSSKIDKVVSAEAALKDFEEMWNDKSVRYEMLPGKEVLSLINGILQEKCKVNVTIGSVINAMKVVEVPDGIRELIDELVDFSK